ncbi:hypothetical protein [Exiguobacterium alkaliphilum]|nr:hypothetical protein [Exiguobacterium alkaliphilum]
MHVSERLLQFYAEHSSSKRTALQTKIQHALSEPTSLIDSFEQLTGERNSELSTEVHTAESFTTWIQEGKKDSAFLLYYVSLLERIDTVLATESQDAIETTETDVPPPPIEKVVTPADTPKRRYTPEAEIPSRAERAKYQRAIEPARPRKRRGGLLAVLALLLLLGGGGYVAYPYVLDLLESREEANEPKTEQPAPEPVAETPAVESVWLTTKNVDLVSAPNSSSVTYIGDIGDRYDIVGTEGEYVEVRLGDATAWAPTASTTAEWKSASLTDEVILSWVETNLNMTYTNPPETFVAYSESELYDAIGQPFGEERDALNLYAFYSGVFFVIQDETVHAIDWTNTGVSKESFMTLGEPTLETEDAVVYESETYSLRLFIGTNGSTRVRLTEI